jgi:energy-coupling factor transport system permease protein
VRALNPTTKLVAALAGTGLSLAWGGWVAGAVIALSAAAALRAGRLRRLAVAGLALLPVALSSLLVNTLLPAGGGGATTAAAALLRLLGATLPPTLLFATTPVGDLLADLEARGLGRRATFVLGAALAAVPRTQARAADVIEAQRARGLDTEGAWWRRARGVMPLVAPLVIGGLAEVEERALALEVRAFGAPGRRTVLRAQPDSGGQRLLRWGLGLLLALGLAVRAAGLVAGR